MRAYPGLLFPIAIKGEHKQAVSYTWVTVPWTWVVPNQNSVLYKVDDCDRWVCGLTEVLNYELNSSLKSDFHFQPGCSSLLQFSLIPITETTFLNSPLIPM